MLCKEPQEKNDSEVLVNPSNTMYNTYYFVRIIPRTNEQDYIDVFRGRGCYSNIGRTGGKQALSLGKGCAVNVGIPIHELMHAIGKYEQNSNSIK